MEKKEKISSLALNGPDRSVWVRRILGLMVAVVFVVAAIGVVNVGMLPNKFLIPGLAVATVAVAALLYGLMRKKRSKWASVVLSVLAVLTIAGSLIVYSFSRATDDFFGGIVSSSYRYEQYDVIAKKASVIELRADKDSVMGLLQTDSNNDEVKKVLDDKTDAQMEEIDSLTSLVAAVESDELEMMTVKSSYTELIKENFTDFHETAKIIYSFKIRVESNLTSSDIDATKPFVLYISGIDTYGGISTASRSDVNILAVVNPKTNKILLVNTPRDYYVQLHGTTGTRDKLTHAGIYGIDMSIKTLEDLYGVRTDRYLRVNFTSLISVVDAIGGVTVDSEYAFKNFRQGENTLNGQQALEFSRERYSFTEGDRQRGRNQQKVIEAIIAKMSDPQTLMNYQGVLTPLQSALQTNVSQATVKTLVNSQLNDMKRWHVQSISVDGTGATMPTYSMGAQPLYVLQPDEASVAAAKAAIENALR